MARTYDCPVDGCDFSSTQKGITNSHFGKCPHARGHLDRVYEQTAAPAVPAVEPVPLFDDPEEPNVSVFQPILMHICSFLM